MLGSDFALFLFSFLQIIVYYHRESNLIELFTRVHEHVNGQQIHKQKLSFIIFLLIINLFRHKSIL